MQRTVGGLPIAGCVTPSRWSSAVARPLAESGQMSDRLVDLVQSCLPVDGDLGKLCSRVAAFWQAAVADAACVLVRSPDGRTSVGALASASGPNCRFAGVDETSLDAVRSRLLQECGFRGVAASSVPLVLDVDPVGSLFLFSNDQVSERPGVPVDGHLVDATARLLATGRQLAAAKKGDVDPIALQSAKLAAMEQLAAGAGHEVNNPIGAITGRVELLLRSETDAEKRDALARIHANAWRVHEMIGDLMLIARPPEPRRERTDVCRLAGEVAEKMTDESVRRRCVVSVRRPGEDIFAMVDPVQLKVVLSSLLRNSFEALPNGGPVDIIVLTDGRGRLQLCVEDAGNGLQATDWVHHLDPFYSGRQAGRGLGFGLSKAWRIVRNHDGLITLGERPGGGTSVRIELPRVE